MFLIYLVSYHVINAFFFFARKEFILKHLKLFFTSFKSSFSTLEMFLTTLLFLWAHAENYYTPKFLFNKNINNDIFYSLHTWMF